MKNSFTLLFIFVALVGCGTPKEAPKPAPVKKVKPTDVNKRDIRNSIKDALKR
jgi:hypothetical protein